MLPLCVSAVAGICRVAVTATTAVSSLYANSFATIFKYYCMWLFKCCHHCGVNVTTVMCNAAATVQSCHCV